MTYGSAVIQHFYEAKPYLHQDISQWFVTRDEEQAKALLQRFPQGANLRFRFRERTPQDKLIKQVFDTAFLSAPEELIQKAEQFENKTAYPLWKRVVWIHAPQAVGNLLKNPIFKTILIVSFWYRGVVMGLKYYAILENVLKGRLIPFAINNTPPQVAQITNVAINGLKTIYAHPYKSIFYAWVFKSAILAGPELPFVTPAIRSINLVAIFGELISSPQTIVGFLVNVAFDAAKTVGDGIDEVGEIFLDLGAKANAERLAVCKPQAYDLWCRSL